MITTNNAFHYLSWPVQNVVAFTTTTHHPEALQSLSCFGSFNLGLHVGDNEDKVHQNRNLLLKYLPQNSSIQWLNQVHGNHVEIITDVSQALTADASITQQNNIALAIMTADCLPIILSSKGGKEIAAIHGGWKPLSKDIIKHTLQSMRTNPQEIYAWLGPCIGPNAFEVGEDVYHTFVSNQITYQEAFVKVLSQTNEKKYLANLHHIAKIQLQQLGVQYIYSLPHCTMSQNQDYYSYRRASKTGRMATLICRM